MATSEFYSVPRLARAFYNNYCWASDSQASSEAANINLKPIPEAASDPCNGQASKPTQSASDPHCAGQAMQTSKQQASDPVRINAGQANLKQASDPQDDGQAITMMKAASDPLGQAATPALPAMLFPHLAGILASPSGSSTSASVQSKPSLLPIALAAVPMHPHPSGASDRNKPKQAPASAVTPNSSFTAALPFTLRAAPDSSLSPLLSHFQTSAAAPLPYSLGKAQSSQLQPPPISLTCVPLLLIGDIGMPLQTPSTHVQPCSKETLGWGHPCSHCGQQQPLFPSVQASPSLGSFRLRGRNDLNQAQVSKATPREPKKPYKCPNRVRCKMKDKEDADEVGGPQCKVESDMQSHHIVMH